MAKFDLQAHNIRKMSIADALKAYKSTRSAAYKLKLRIFLKLADARLRGLIAQAKRMPSLSAQAAAGIEAMRRDAAMIAEGLRQ